MKKTDRVRPLVAGISVGHISITAGTLAIGFRKDGKVYLTSNAHVFTDNPFLKPEQIKVKIIVQPGPYDGGSEEDYALNYIWHQKLYDVYESPPPCPISQAIDWLYYKLKRKSMVVTFIPNHIDFAYAFPVVPFKNECFSDIPDNAKFVGHIFAGSPGFAVFCKTPKYFKADWLWPWVEDVKAGDLVCKDGRTTCYKEGKVIYSSANVMVNYTWGVAMFYDVVITEKIAEPGDSGSPVFLIK